MADTFVETNCTFKHEGKEFTQGGAFLADCTDGYRRGIVYAQMTEKAPKGAGSWGEPGAGIVTDWHGNKLADVWYGPVYRDNFCSMQSISFTLAGIKYTGRYCPDTSQAVRVRSTVKIPAR